MKRKASPRIPYRSQKKLWITNYIFLVFCIFSFIGLVRDMFRSFEVISPIADVSAADVSPTPAPSPTPTSTPTPGPLQGDVRVTTLKAYLSDRNSPLAPFADLIVAQADQYDIGWTKIVAISAMESSLGTNTRPGSHNAWGIGGRDFRYFPSWEAGIKYTSWLLGTHYKTNELKAIQVKYCPSHECNPAWTSVVEKTSTKIINTAYGK